MRLRYNRGNRAPVAVASAATPTAGPAPLKVWFLGKDSYDLDVEPLTYRWDFGDGTSSTDENPLHTYANRGEYTARLTVTDALGATSSATLPITAGNSPPVLLVTLPPAGTRYAVGDDVQLPVVAADAEDGLIPASHVTYEQRIRHCPFGDCHEHPSVTTTVEDGQTFSCVIPDHGDDAFLEIIISVTDSDGLRTSQTVELDTDVHDLRVSSAPAGVPITVNQTDSNAHPVGKAITGSQNRVVAPLTSGGKQFVSWSDGGAADHAFTMPGSDVSLVATYDTPPVARAAASPAAGGTPLATTLSAAGSSDADGDALTYRWSFGDGQVGAGRDVPHTYTAVGTYVATVTATDTHGVARSATTTIRVGTGPLCMGQWATIVGTAGNDRLVGTAGRDVIWAGNGDDQIAGLGGDDLICGGPGTDLLDESTAPAGVAVFLQGPVKYTSGGAGNDRVESIEDIAGSAFVDWLIGKDGPTTIAGGAGNDTISGIGGGDRLDGGPGIDTVDYSLSPVGVRVLLDLSPPRARAGTADADVLTTFENVVGTASADVLVGDGLTNRLYGLGGDDTLGGNGSNDALDGGAGIDGTDGGAGNDICTTAETRTSCER